MTVKEREMRALWQQTFHDDERFVELLFSHLYSDENAIGVEQDGVLITALQMLPYRITMGQSLLDVAYVSGAATRPECRNQGWMSRLLTRAFHEMHARRIPLSALIPAEPWLYDYYAARGYAQVFLREERRYPATHRFESKVYYPVTPAREELFAFFEEQMLRRPICLQHNRADFEVVCCDVELEGGAILSLADEAGRLVAATWVVIRDHEVVIKELLALTADAEEAMLHEVQTSFPGKPICQYRQAVGEGMAVGCGMIRLVDVATVLSVVAENDPALRVTFRVTDKSLPHNDGGYCLSGGECRREPVEHPDYDVDVAELATLLFGKEGLAISLNRPYMSLMLD